MEQVVKGLVIRQLVAAVRQRLAITLAGVQNRQVQISAAAAAAAAATAMKCQVHGGAQQAR
jgi:hypothetical protein